MRIEYEATYTDINRDEIRTKLKSIGAKLVKPHFMQRREVFNLPRGHEIDGGWLRVRDEGDKVTMSLKIVKNNSKIEDQKETEITVNDFGTATVLLETLGCKKKAYQESYRELWTYENVEITIDEWPFLEPFVEIESVSEEKVRSLSDKLGLDYQAAYFGSVDGLYSKKYNISEKRINQETPEILFNMENPFL